MILTSDVDEVRRVRKNPGDLCGFTRQYYQRSGLPLPSPWIKCWSVFSSWLCCSLISSTFSYLQLIKSFTESPVTLLMSSIHRIRRFPFYLPLQLFPAIYLTQRIDVPSSRVRNIAFSAFLLWLLMKCLVLLSVKCIC